VSTTPTTITSPTRKLSQSQIDVLRSLQGGHQIRVVQTLRVGSRKWQTTVDGVFREMNYLATGVTTDRVPDDDIVVPMVHFTKAGGEMTSIAMDENTEVRLL
jgi:hypothetical protein